MKLRRASIAIIATIVFFPLSIVSAEYTLILKNGRRITVQSYREEGRSIKFYGAGGEIGIPRDEVQSIVKGGAEEGRGLDLRGAATQDETVSVRPEQETARDSGSSKAPTPAELTPEEQRAKEEKEYQDKIRELTESLKAATDRYAVATRGSSGPEPSVPVTEKEMQRRADDLTSRLRDVQQGQAGVRYEPGIESPKPATLSTDPPPLLQPGPVVARPSADPLPEPYTQKQKELSELRGQINQLETERQKLIDEMRQKNFATGSLFVE